LISVIIPTFNRPLALQNCLTSLKNQTLTINLWEVIVVNDGGCEVKSLVQDFGSQFHCISQENSGPAKARNNGAAFSKGNVLAFLDDDCQAQTNWLEEIHQLSHEGYIIGGKVTNALVNNVYSETSQVLIDFLYQNQQNTSIQFFTSNNFTIFKEDFERSGGFSTAFRTSAGEDREFCVRLNNMGVKLKFQPSIKVHHYHALTFLKFMRLHMKYGMGALTYKKELSQLAIPIKPRPQVCFYVKMLQYPFSIATYNLLKKIKISCLLFLSQFYVALGYYKAKFFLKH